MLIISHRGNLTGPDPALENHPDQIDRCISQYQLNVEVDLRVINGYYWLGHDKPEYKVSLDWLMLRKNFLWIHCKNIEAMIALRNSAKPQALNFFWHQEDDFTMTSRGFIWAYPGQEMPSHTYSIAVMPEIYDTNYKNFYGICTDHAERFVI